MKRIFGLGVISIFFISSAIAQCEDWHDSPKKDEAENGHVIYRQAIKQWSQSKDEGTFNEAFTNWKTAYSIAPAADGKRASHYIDGRKLYIHLYNNETDTAKKQEYYDTIIRLFDEEASCYGPAYKTLGRKSYDLFYTLNAPSQDVFDAAKQAVDEGGNKCEYVVLLPYAGAVVDFFTKEKISKEEARNIYNELNEIADYNIANNAKLSSYFQQTKDAMNDQFSAIQYHIFDCVYFKDKLLPQYEADPNNRELYREIYKKLVQGGCDKSDPILLEIARKDEVYINAEKARIETEKQQNNPAWYANALYKKGKFTEATEQYKKAISEETDPVKLASYYFSLASIQGRKLKSYSAARSSARKAAEHKSGWGKPYILIGDLYAMSSKNCGKDIFEQQMAILAAMDKWAYAKNVDSDPEIVADANRKIANYSKHKPEKGEGHMRGVKPGDTYHVGCWIGENVKARFQ